MSSNKFFASVGFQLLTIGILLVSGFNAWAQPAFNANFTPDTIGVGSTSTLTFTIDNSASATTATDLTFSNTLPAGVTIASPGVPLSECINGLVVAPEGGDTISFTEGRVSSNTVCTVSVNVTSATVGTSTNTSSDLTSSQGNSGTASADLTVDPARPGFTKSFAPSTVNFGDRSTLTLTIDNSLNNSIAQSITFTDNFPIGMEIADPSGLVSNCTMANITAIPGSRQLSANGSFLLANETCTITVDVLAQARGRLNNTSGELQSSPGGPLESSGKASAVLVVNGADDLQLTQSFIDDPVAPGSQIELAFTLTNLNRNFTVTDIGVTNDLDATLSGLFASGLPLNDVCGTGSQLSGTSLLTLTGASLAPESSCTFSILLGIPAAAVSGEYPNVTSAPSGTVDGRSTTGIPSTDSLFISLAPELSKTFINSSIQAGDTTTMEFTLTNLSTTDTASDITFNDNLSTFLSSTQVVSIPATGFCGAGSNAFTTTQAAEMFFIVSGANLAPGASCTFSAELLVQPNTPPGTYTNTTGQVTATLNGQTYASRSASADLTVLDLPQLNMQFIDDPIGPGDTVSVQYRISSSQEGNLTATDINFTHDLGATLVGLTAIGLPLNDVCGSGSQITGTTSLALTGGSISTGIPCEFTVDLQIPAAATNGTYPSTTSDLTTTVNTQAITSAAATDDLQIGSLSFTKQFVDDPSLPGGTVTLRYTIENLNPSEHATDMVFTDNLSNVFNGLVAGAPLPTNPCGASSSLSGTNFLIFTGGNLTAGDTCIFDVQLSIPAAVSNNQYISASSTLSATVGGNPTVTTPAVDTLTINNNLIFFNKSYLNNPVSPGATTTLEFTLNNGSQTEAISNLAFTDDLGASLTGLTATAVLANDCGFQVNGIGTPILTTTDGSLVAGGSCTLTVELTVPGSSASGAYTNMTSNASGTLNGLNVMGDPASDDLFVGFLGLTKAFSGPVDTGATTTLNFTLTNNDVNFQSNLAFTDDLDAVLSGLVAVGLPLNDVCGAGSQISGTSVLTVTNAELATNDSCSFDVTVQVPAGLSDSTYTNVTSELLQNGLPVSAPATAQLVVNGVPFINLSSNTVDFGTAEVGTTATPQTVTISNTGTADLSVTNITTATVPFGSDVSGSCPAVPFSLAANDSCTLAFTFSPIVTALASQNIVISSDSGGTINSTIQLSGSGLQAALTLSPNPVDFGVTELNTSSPNASVTLNNSGTANLDITNITAASGDFAQIGGTCGALPIVLAPTASCVIDYQFTPTAAGIQSQNISFISDAATSPDVLVLQGNGVTAELTLGSSQLNFPNTTFNTTSTELLQTITNSGLVDLRITNLTAPNTPFTLSGGTCSALPITLAVGNSCTLGFEFTPLSATNYNQAIVVNSNASTNPDSFDLTGTGIEPGLQLSVASLDFQTVELNTTSTPLEITLSNTDAGDLEINTIDVANAPFSQTGGTCGGTPFTLAASQSCTLSYQFNPTTTGVQNQTITITSNASTSPDSFTLQGESVQAALNLASVQLSFSDTNINMSSVDLTQTVSNTGVIELRINNLTTASGPFVLSGGSCSTLPIVLAVNESCTLTYQFMPTTAGTFNQSISVDSNAASSPDSFTLNGTGIDIDLSSNVNQLNFNFTSVNDVQTQNINLSNNGNDDVIINNINLPSAPFAADFSNCGTLPITLTMGDSCVIEVTYITENATNSDSLSISSNDPNSPLVINLLGNGLSNPTPIPANTPLGLWIISLLMILFAGQGLRLKRKLNH